MDPNETLRMIYDALSEGRWGDAEELSAALANWTLEGGFEPDRHWGDVSVRELTQLSENHKIWMKTKDGGWVLRFDGNEFFGPDMGSVLAQLGQYALQLNV